MSVKLSFGFSGIHSAHETISLVERAETAGFESVWISEDYFQYGAFSLAGACAVKTSRIQIGIGVINPYTRHPALSAMEAAAADELSHGRLIVGLGASNRVWMETQAGIPYKKPFTATVECMRIMQGLLFGGEVEFKGNYFSTGKVRLENEPFRPELPIFLGVKGDKGLDEAGRSAAGILFSVGTPVEFVKYARKRARDAAIAVGRNPDEIKFAAYLPIYANRDGGLARAKMRSMTAEFIGMHGVQPILLTAGLTEEQIIPFQEAFLSGSAPKAAPTDEMVDKLMIAGTPDHCMRRIYEYIDAGVDLPILFEATGVCPPEETIDMIKECFM